MDIVTFILTPISGAIIGYFTNWLAIKMLFRPYEQKTLFGIKIPFTPGLIPKERYVLSEKVGKTLSNNVLTSNVMQEYISSPEMTEKIVDIVNNSIDSLCKNEKTIIECFEHLSQNQESDKKSDFVDNLSSSVSDFIISWVEESLPFEKIASFLYDKIIEILKSPEVTANITEKHIKDIIKPEFLIYLKQISKEKCPNAIDWLRQIPEENKALDESLRKLVKTTAEENFGKFVSIFMNYDKIYDNIKDKIFEYLANEENQTLIIDKLFDKADILSEKSLDNIFSSLPDNIKSTISEIFKNFTENDQIKGKLTQNIQKFMSDEVKKNLPSLLEKYFDKFFNMKISEILEKLPEKYIELIKEKSNIITSMALRHGGTHIAESLEFDRIVEQKINDFSVEEAEGIILSVVKKELNSITVVGGVLGFVIGFVPLILSLLQGHGI